MSTQRLRGHTHRTAATAFFCVALALGVGSGCASVNRNATAVILGGVLGTAGGVAGFAVTNNNAEGAAAGAAAGAAIGGAIGHQIDKLIWRKEAERTHTPCPYCGHSIKIEHCEAGASVFCSKCGRASQARARARK